MRRDWDLIRFLMLELEGGEPEDKDWTEEERKYHWVLLTQSPLVEGGVIEHSTGEQSAYILNLTMEGHDFLTWARDERVWNDARNLLKTQNIGETLKHLGWAADKVMRGDYR